MNKLALFLLGVLAGVIVIYLFVAPRGVGVSIEEPRFSSASEAQIACSSVNATTSVLVAGGARSSFIATNVGANPIFLCRDTSVCTSTSSIVLSPIASSTALTRFVQEDAYTGVYLCSASGATTSLNIVYSQ